MHKSGNGHSESNIFLIHNLYSPHNRSEMHMIFSAAHDGSFSAAHDVPFSACSGRLKREGKPIRRIEKRAQLIKQRPVKP